MKRIFCALVFIVVLQMGSLNACHAQELVDVQSAVPGIAVRLIYSTTDNFLASDIYGEQERCYLNPECAGMLKRAQEILNKRRKGFSLLIFDGARPLAVQRAMWNVVKGTPQERYVANPEFGSLHNYGAAVDCSLQDKNGIELDMGTSVDYFGALAEPRYEEKFLREGKLTVQQIRNRTLLRSVMHAAGFQSIASEWWHFQQGSKEDIKKRYEIIQEFK